MQVENNQEFDFCFVANIIGFHYWGEQRKLVSGTKYFSANTKVYCNITSDWRGDGRVIVYGKKRNSTKMIEISINRKNIKNLRIQKVFNPSILAVIKDYENPRIHNYHDEFIAFMNNNHLEINVSNNEDKIDTNPIT